MEKNRQFGYALDENGDVIHISKIDVSNRHNVYRCISCGSELIPVLGEKNVHHFRHKTDICSYESYLHKAAKRILETKFNTSDKFEIIVPQKSKCDKYDNCPFAMAEECVIRRDELFDIKKNNAYNLCQEEQSVLDGQFVADLLITNRQGNKKPLLIEIYVTHKSTEEKIHSRLPIIEIKIDNEDQLEQLEQLPIGSENVTYTTEYINFIELSKNPCRHTDIKRPLRLFSVYKSGKYFFDNLIDYESGNVKFDCSKIFKSNRPNTLIELALPPYCSSSVIPLYHCYKKRIKACFCSLCFFSTESMSGTVCKLYKSKGTPHYPLEKGIVDCAHFSINRQIENILNSEIQQTPIVELPWEENQQTS